MEHIAELQSIVTRNHVLCCLPQNSYSKISLIVCDTNLLPVAGALTVKKILLLVGKS